MILIIIISSLLDSLINWDYTLAIAMIIEYMQEVSRLHVAT